MQNCDKDGQSMTHNGRFQDCNCKYPLTSDRLRMKIDKHFNGIPENYKKEGYDSQCDPRTLMNSLKCADETSFADRAASFKSLKGSLLWKRGTTCTEFQLTMRHFQLLEKLLIKRGKWRLFRFLTLLGTFYKHPRQNGHCLAVTKIIRH